MRCLDPRSDDTVTSEHLTRMLRSALSVEKSVTQEIQQLEFLTHSLCLITES